MPAIDYSNMTTVQKYNLVDEILASIKPEAIRLTAAQEAEIIHRLATFDEDIKHEIDADALEAELDRRYA